MPETHCKLTLDVDKSKLPFSEIAADKVAEIIGSWKFIIIQSVFLTFWVILNVTSFICNWDPYPFIFLNLMLSFQAAYSAPIIQMSANRQAIKDRQMAYEDCIASENASDQTVLILEEIKKLISSQNSNIAIDSEEMKLLKEINEKLNKIG